jgi:hypothetical protein
MTEEERTQLQKDVLYEQYLAQKEYGEYMAKIEMMNQRLRDLSDAFRHYISSLHEVVQSGEEGNYRKYLPIDFDDLEDSCNKVVALKKRLAAAGERKKLLGI